MSEHKIAIIGSGPAGFTAAIYTARASIDTTVYMGLQPGGQLTTTTEIENFPGFVDGIDGGELMQNMQKQSERFGTTTIQDEVKNLEIEYPKSKVIFATHNPSKVERINNYIKINNLEITQSPEKLVVAETGENETENASLKAKAYWDKFQTPSFALDTGLYFDAVDESEQPGHNVQGIAGVLETDDDETRYQKMKTWYVNLANKYSKDGQNLTGYWLDVYALYDGKEFKYKSCKRPLELTNQEFQKDVHLPVASLYKVKGKYYHELSVEETEEYIQPSMKALTELLVQFQQSHNPKFYLEVAGKQEQFDAVIIASGASARYIGIPGEEKYIGKGYHSCATCDGFFYRKKEIIMVGGGDSAMEEANFLTKFASKVHLIHRSDQYRASKIMLDRAQNNPKIEFHPFKQIVGFEGEDKVEGVKIQNTQTQQISSMPIDGVFVAIGHIPNSGFSSKYLKPDKKGYLSSQNLLDTPDRTSKYLSMSQIPGLFIAGDVQDQIYRQAITAAGEGCKAAMDLERWLESRE